MTKEERDAVQARCVSIDNIIISIERELRMLRTHLDILTKVCKTEPTISKMEQVDKDINVRSKDEPNCQECKHFHENAVMYLDQCDFCFKDCKYEPKDEPQLTPNYCGTCKHREVPCGDLPCDVCHGYSNYEPKDEPQTDCPYKEYPCDVCDNQTDCPWK